jgi:hypothetical protein
MPNDRDEVCGCQRPEHPLGTGPSALHPFVYETEVLVDFGRLDTGPLQTLPRQRQEVSQNQAASSGQVL